MFSRLSGLTGIVMFSLMAAPLVQPILSGQRFKARPYVRMVIEGVFGYKPGMIPKAKRKPMTIETGALIALILRLKNV